MPFCPGERSLAPAQARSAVLRFVFMDRLRHDDIERARRTPPEEKLRQALDLMAAGIELHRAGLRARRPEATEAEIDAEVRRWLIRDDR